MSEANRQLARRWFEQVWNQQDVAAIEEMFHSQGKCHGFPDPDSVLVGPEAFKDVHRTFRGAFPDIHVTVEDVIAEADRVAIRWTATMTHLGDHLGFPATRKKAALTGSSFITVNANQIVEAWNEMDIHNLYLRLQSEAA